MVINSNIKPTSFEGYKLLHDGVVALSEVENNGIAVDTQYLENTLTELDRRIRRLTMRLKEQKEWALWRKRFGVKSKLGSREQLAEVLFDVMGYPSPSQTDKGRHKADESALATVRTPFVKNYLKLTKLEKVRTTYLTGIQRETLDGVLRPFFNLHNVRTFRSSSDTPNFQNMPIRNPEMGKLIRRALVPRPGRVLIEVDYSGVEVRVAACYHKDPQMLTYINDSSTDMHRDMAAQIYKLDTSEVQKHHRYCGKNKFVFPQFYGDYYINSAKSMWEAIEQMDLKGPAGEPLDQYLKTKGIKKRGACDPQEKPKAGTFEKHMQEVENDFWNRRFKVYGKWKRKWYADYLKTGGFETLTGFRLEGEMAKNDVINYPVQGSAFHCLLWSVTQVVKAIKRYKMKTLVVGQIHDSIVADVPAEEVEQFLELTASIMSDKIKKWAPWLIVPLDIESEITPVGGSWHDKKEYEVGKDLDEYLYPEQNTEGE